MVASCATPSRPSPGEPPAQKATPAAAGKGYSTQERTKLILCVGLTDTAWTVAREKKAGVTKEAVRARYTKMPKPELAFATVDKVFQDEVGHPWDYAVKFFKECAENLANVPQHRTDLGAYCVQNVMIAGLALEKKTAGVAQDEAARSFSAFKSETPRKIVGRVYASAEQRGPLLMGEWESCIGPAVQ